MISPDKRKKLRSQEMNLTDLPGLSQLRMQPAWKREGGNTFTCLKKQPLSIWQKQLVFTAILVVISGWIKTILLKSCTGNTNSSSKTATPHNIGKKLQKATTSLTKQSTLKSTRKNNNNKKITTKPAKTETHTENFSLLDNCNKTEIAQFHFTFQGKK